MYSPESEPERFLPIASAASKTKDCRESSRRASAPKHLLAGIQAGARPAAFVPFLVLSPSSSNSAHSNYSQKTRRNLPPASPGQKAETIPGVLHSHSDFPSHTAARETPAGCGCPTPAGRNQLLLDTKPQFSPPVSAEPFRRVSLPPNRTICRMLCNCPTHF